MLRLTLWDGFSLLCPEPVSTVGSWRQQVFLPSEPVWNRPACVEWGVCWRWEWHTSAGPQRALLLATQHSLQSLLGVQQRQGKTLLGFPVSWPLTHHSVCDYIRELCENGELRVFLGSTLEIYFNPHRHNPNKCTPAVSLVPVMIHYIYT